MEIQMEFIKIWICFSAQPASVCWLVRLNLKTLRVSIRVIKTLTSSTHTAFRRNTPSLKRLVSPFSIKEIPTIISWTVLFKFNKLARRFTIAARSASSKLQKNSNISAIAAQSTYETKLLVANRVVEVDGNHPAQWIDFLWFFSGSFCPGRLGSKSVVYDQEPLCCRYRHHRMIYFTAKTWVRKFHHAHRPRGRFPPCSAMFDSTR